MKMKFVLLATNERGGYEDHKILKNMEEDDSRLIDEAQAFDDDMISQNRAGHVIILEEQEVEMIWKDLKGNLVSRWRSVRNARKK